MAKLKSSDFFKNEGEIKDFNQDLRDGQEEMKKYTDQLKKLRMEAEKLLAANESVNTSTEKGRQETKKNATQVDKLLKAVDKYEEALSDTAVQIAGVRDQTRKLNQANRIEARILASKEGSYNRLSAEYSKAKLQLNAMTIAERKATKAGQDLEKHARDLFEQMKDLQEATGKYTLNVGNYKSAIEGLPGPLNTLQGSLDNVKDGLTAIARHPIIAVFALLVGSVIALFNAFKKTERGMKLIANVTGFVNAGLSKLVSISEDVADGLVFAFDNPLEAAKNLGQFLIDQIVNRLLAIPKIAISVFTAVKEAITFNLIGAQEAAEDAFFAINQLITGLDEAAQRDIAKSLSEQTKELTKQAEAWAALERARIDVAKANRSLERSIEDLITQEQKLIQIQEDDTLAFAIRQKAAEQVADVIERRARVEVQIAKNNLSLINREIALRRQNGEAAFDLLEQQVDAFKQLKAAERDLTLSILEEEEKKRRLKQDTLERDLDILLDGLANQLGINKQLIADDEKTLAERARIFSDSVDIADKSFEKQIETIQKFTDTVVDANDLIQTSDAVLLNEKIRSLGLSEIIEGRLLEIIRDRRDATLELIQIERGLIQERKALTADLPQIGSIINERQFESAAQDAKVLIARAKGDLFAELNPTDEEPKSFFDLLGFNLGDGEEQAIASAFDFAKQQLISFGQVRKQLADQQVALANQNVQAAQQELQTQLQLAALGQAAKVKDAQQSLQLAKQTQEKALKDQERAAKAQLVFDTIQQTSSLVSASAKIWSQLGFPFALPAIGVMFGSFAAAKIKAFQLSKQEFGDGGLEIIGGGSHASGNDTPLGFRTKQGKQAYGEKGEAHMILPRGVTRRYRKTLPRIYEGLKAGNFESMFMQQRNITNEAPKYGSDNIIVQTTRMEMYLRELIKQGKNKQGYTPDGKKYEQRFGTFKTTG